MANKLKSDCEITNVRVSRCNSLLVWDVFMRFVDSNKNIENHHPYP